MFVSEPQELKNSEKPNTDPEPKTKNGKKKYKKVVTVDTLRELVPLIQESILRESNGDSIKALN